MRFFILLIIFFATVVIANTNSIAIIYPTNKTTFQNNESGIVDVRVNLTSTLQKDNKLLILLDNKIVLTSTSSTITLKAIDRGEHHLQAQIIDNTGKILTTSNTITFYMHRPLVKKS